MWAPFGRNRGEPGLYRELVNRSCSVPSVRWSACGVGGFSVVEFKVGGAG